MKLIFDKADYRALNRRNIVHVKWSDYDQDATKLHGALLIGSLVVLFVLTWLIPTPWHIAAVIPCFAVLINSLMRLSAEISHAYIRAAKKQGFDLERRDQEQTS